MQPNDNLQPQNADQPLDSPAPIPGPGSSIPPEPAVPEQPGAISQDTVQPSINQNQGNLSTSQQPFASPQSPQSFVDLSPPPAPRKRKWPKILALIVLLVLVLSAGGAYAYWTMLNNKPEKVLADALSNTMTDLLERKPTTSVGSFILESKDTLNPYKVRVDFNAKQANDSSEVAATLGLEYENLDISVKGTAITIDSKEVYVKFDDVQKTADDIVAAYPEYAEMIRVYEPLIRKIDGQWIKIDTESLAAYSGTEEEEINKCTTAFEQLRIAKDDQKRIKDIFARNQFAIATEKLPNEGVDGESSYHYKLDLNEQAAVTFTKELVELPSFAALKQDCEIQPEDFDRQLENLQNSVEQTRSEQKPIIELWVGTKTRLPTRFKVTFDNTEVLLELNSVVKIDAQDVAVSPPEQSTTLSQLYTELEALYTQ